MSAVSSIVLADGLTTPVNHTFGIQSQDRSGLILLENRVGGVPIGYERLGLFARPRQGAQQDSKYVMTLAIPTLESVAPGAPPVLAFTDLVEVKFMSSQRSNAANRKNLVVMLKNLLAKAEVETTISNGEAWWI